jgi:hypothetical protein
VGLAQPGQPWTPTDTSRHQDRHAALLKQLLDEPYFAAGPKSTGRDLFNAQWLMHGCVPRNAGRFPAVGSRRQAPG